MIRSRPWKPTRRCGRCGTTFPTRYEWRHHTLADCDGSIVDDIKRMMEGMIDELQSALLFGGTRVVGLPRPSLFGISPHKRYDSAGMEYGPGVEYRTTLGPIAGLGDPIANAPGLTLEAIEAAMAQLGPPPPKWLLRPMPAGIVPDGEIWIVGGAEILGRAFGLAKEE